MNVGVHSCLSILLTFILSTSSSITGTILYLKYIARIKNRPLHQILNFGDDEIIFIFSHRDHVPETILPRTSTEDFMAMNNFISSLIKSGWKNKFSFRDTHRVSDTDRQKNLILICSGKSNKISKEIQDLLFKNNTRFYYHEKIENSKHWHIKDAAGIYPSKTYGEIEDFLNQGGETLDVPGQELNDVAVITKITNPWNAVNKIFIIAGVRGIGTWGAAECLKKEWKQLYEKLPRNKDADFSALIRVKYKNCDIISSKVHNVLLISTEPHTKD